MPARPISSATLSFGLVSVPIQLFSSSESKASISFNWLHKDCGSRLRQQYVCKQDDKVVERDDMVKGYEFAKNQYVVFTPDELKALDEQTKESIDITEFVPADQVDRIYVNKVYYLGPDKGGARAYRLLSAALRKTGLSAIARYSARGKQYLVLIRPEGEGLAMEQLYYSEEIRSFGEVALGDAEVKPEELKLAVQLIEQAASEAFAPQKYEDEVRKRVLAQIERKVEGKEITAAPEEEPQVQIIDLMDALKKSLAQGDTGTKKPAKAAKTKGSAPGRKAAGGGS
ncbi:MAG: Ku protein [Gemmatimonadota bacterium]|nr:Ku protein [Gemmatimonadota bacterium]